MAKYTVSTNDNEMIFTNDKGKVVDTCTFIKAISPEDALAGIKRTVNAEVSGREYALSLMVHILDNPKLDGYKGQTPANASLTKEFKESCREMEKEYLYPLFAAPLERKGNTPPTIQKMWGEWLKDLREGGTWANISSIARQYFAIVGQLPCLYINGQPQKDKLLSGHAMLKLIANLRTASDTTDKGIAGKLFDLLDIVENRTEKTNLGHTGTAIASLERLLNHYKAIDAYEREQALTAYQNKADSEGRQPSVTDAAHAVVQKAKKNKGQLPVKAKQDKVIEPAPL